MTEESTALTERASFAPVSLKELEQAADWIVTSKLFGIKEKAQAVALMMIAQAEGSHYATAAQDYDIIAGKANRKTNSVLARFQQAGGTVRWVQLNEQVAEAEFSHPKGGSVTIKWTIEMANRITVTSWDDSPGAARGAKITQPLTNKDNWKNFPRAMLRARTIAEGVRTVYPAAIGGALVAEEAMDLPVDHGDHPAVEQPVARSEQATQPEKAAGATIDGSATRVAEESGPPTLADCEALLKKGDIASATDLARSLPEEDRKKFDDLRVAAIGGTPPTDKPLQPGQERILRARCNTAGVAIADLEQHIGKKFTAFAFGDFEPAQKWLLERAETK